MFVFKQRYATNFNVFCNNSVSDFRWFICIIHAYHTDLYLYCTSAIPRRVASNILVHLPSDVMLLDPKELIPFSSEPPPTEAVDRLSGGVGAGRFFFSVGVDLPIDF